MDYYQQKGKTIFGSTYKGKFNSDYETDRTALGNEEFIKRIEKLIDHLIVYFGDIERVRAGLASLKSAIKNGIFDFRIDADEFARLFIEKTGLKFSRYKNIKDSPLRADIVISILKCKFGDGKFDYDQEKEYLFNRIKEIMKDNPKKTSFMGSDLLAYEITKLEPYFYKNSFRRIDLNDADKELRGRDLFLFQIYCKDFSPKLGSNVKNPIKDINTLQFEELFSKENQEEALFKLSGQAEIFFQDKIDEYKFEQWDRKDLKNPKTNKIPYKKRRYTKRQIHFHVSIVLNNINKGGNINQEINRLILEQDDIKVLGIDRGEKHLAYQCLLDSDGKIIGDIVSMNIVGSNLKNGKPQKVDYQKKLDIKEKERLMARRSWTKIEGIKDIKRGFNANAIHEIARIVVEQNTVLCLEELNHGFKRDRTKIEKSIYQQFENAMVDKLSYLVLEKTPQGIRNALQLVKSVDNEGKKIAQKYWGNQMGAIFYTDAKFTSKTCPHCGFRRRGVESMKTAKEVKEKIEKGQLKVFYEKDKDRFRIEYSWKIEVFEFSCGDLYGKGVMEVIYSDVERSSWNNDSLKHIFKGYLQDNVQDNIDLLTLVKNDSRFNYIDFGKVFNSLTWLRHTVKQNGKEYDRISCPKCHFSTMSDKVRKINNGDANGAYNIARRGLLILEKIRSDELRKKITTKDGIKSKDIKITLKEWDEVTYAQWDKKDWGESNNARGL